MDFLQSLLENFSQYPIITAFVLGLMTAISPCPLATNITATAYISKNIANKKKVFFSGIVYALGRAFSYTILGLLLFFGASKFHIALFLNQNGERILGPLLVVLGLIMLNVIHFRFLSNFNLTEKLTDKFKDKGMLGTFLIGIVFALAFCPYSGALFFGMLIPITITSVDGLYLPLIFAFGTGLPVIIFSFLLAFATAKIGVLFIKISKVEVVMRKVAGFVFIIIGIYYILIFTELI